MPKGIKGFQKGMFGGNSPNWRGGKIKIKCIICGKIREVSPSVIKNGNVKYCSTKCYSLDNSGENSPLWKGGKVETNKRLHNKNKNILKYKLNIRMASGIYNSLKKGIKNGRHWETLVPYNYKQLKKQLISTMPEGYIWQDFMNGKLDIDHIRPINSFNFNKPEDFEFQQCWALDNLQLLTVKENRSKQDKLIKPFQTNLKIAI